MNINPSEHPLLLIGPKMVHLGRFFERKGYPISTVAQLKEAKRVLAQIQPDLIIFELGQPGAFDGFVRHIKETLPHLPMLILDHSSKAGQIVQLIEKGVHGYISTPPNEEKLFQVIDQWLTFSKAQLDHQSSQTFIEEMEKIKEHHFQLFEKSEALEEELQSYKGGPGENKSSSTLSRLSHPQEPNCASTSFSDHTLHSVPTFARLSAPQAIDSNTAALPNGQFFTVFFDSDPGLKILGWTLNIEEIETDRPPRQRETLQGVGSPPSEFVWKGTDAQGHFVAQPDRTFLWRLVLQVDGNTYIQIELLSRIVTSLAENPPEAMSQLTVLFPGNMAHGYAPPPPTGPSSSTSMAPAPEFSADANNDWETDEELLSMLEDDD